MVPGSSLVITNKLLLALSNAATVDTLGEMGLTLIVIIEPVISLSFVRVILVVGVMVLLEFNLLPLMPLTVIVLGVVLPVVFTREIAEILSAVEFAPKPNVLLLRLAMV